MQERVPFRDPTGDVAYQRQLRDRYAGRPVPTVPHLDVGRAIVRPVSRKTAARIIFRYEWLGTMAHTSHHFGIFFGDYCAGVTCLGFRVTGGPHVHKPFGLGPRDVLTLARGACTHWAPPGSNSKLVSWSCRLLAADRTAKLVIAYADTDAGEIGTIYQACGWTYIGRTAASPQWVAPNGRVYDGKLPGDLRRRHRGEWQTYAAQLRRAGWRQQYGNPKHKYVRILDRGDAVLSALVAAMSKPYPKREPESS
jgi:hypothetical protein